MKFKVTNHTEFVKGEEEVCEDFFTSEIVLNEEAKDYLQIYADNQSDCRDYTNLIANAPEMLEALKRVRRDIQMYCTDNPNMKDSYLIINETIKKATEL